MPMGLKALEAVPMGLEALEAVPVGLEVEVAIRGTWVAMKTD